MWIFLLVKHFFGADSVLLIASILYIVGYAVIYMHIFTEKDIPWTAWDIFATPCGSISNRLSKVCKLSGVKTFSGLLWEDCFNVIFNWLSFSPYSSCRCLKFSSTIDLATSTWSEGTWYCKKTVSRKKTQNCKPRRRINASVRNELNSLYHILHSDWASCEHI